MRKLLVALALPFQFLFSACISKDDAPVSVRERLGTGAIVLRFAESSSDIHPSAAASEYFARLVEKKSGGKIRIKVYFDGKLGSSKSVLEQLEFGGVAFGRVGLAELAEAVPAMSHFSSKAAKRANECREIIIDNMDFISDRCLAEKLYPLAVFYPDRRCLYSESRRYFLTSKRQLEGLKVGTASPAIFGSLLGEYGAVPVETGGSDSYQSMQSGFVNLMDADFADFLLGSDYLFSNYLMFFDYVSNPSFLLVSNEVWNGLSVEQRKIIRDCAWKTASYQRNMLERFYVANLDTVCRQKNVVHILSE